MRYGPNAPDDSLAPMLDDEQRAFEAEFIDGAGRKYSNWDWIRCERGGAGRLMAGLRLAFELGAKYERDKAMKTTIMIILCGLMLASCAVPERSVCVRTYDGITIATEAESHERGYQLWWGERHDAVGRESSVSEIGKREMGAVATAAIGAAAGAYLGGMPGAVLGGAGGAAAAMVGKEDRATTGTASTPVKARGMAIVNPQVDSLITPQALGIMGPAAREALKAYIRLNPEECRLSQIIGQEAVFALIDSLAVVN